VIVSPLLIHLLNDQFFAWSKGGEEFLDDIITVDTGGLGVEGGYDTVTHDGRGDGCNIGGSCVKTTA
jgi:hypothetical protein